MAISRTIKFNLPFRPVMYIFSAPSPTPTFFQPSKLWMLLSCYTCYLDQLTILIGLEVCGGEGEGGTRGWGEADGENSGKNILFTSSKLEGGKTALLA